MTHITYMRSDLQAESSVWLLPLSGNEVILWRAAPSQAAQLV